MSARTPDEVLQVFDELCHQVAEALGSTRDWGPSGIRDGQYGVDVTVDRVCVDRLAAEGWAVLSEESGFRPGTRSESVIVDPLDGSTNASRGIPWYATSLCLVADGAATVAMVANHATGVRYTAVAGQGAMRSGVMLRTSDCRQLSEAIVGVSGWPTHHYGWAQFRAFGAAALDVCSVADGTLDAWCDMSRDAHGVWDYAAGLLIATEAGAAAAEVDDRSLLSLEHADRRTPIIASTPDLLAELLAERRRGTGR